jgi:hypothetical protein
MTTIDLTQVIIATIGGFFTVGSAVFAIWLQSHMKDKEAAATILTAVKNSLGAMQQAATAGIRVADPRIALPASTPPQIAAGVQYVLDNAGAEVLRLGLTPDVIASKISAQVGLANIATNLAVAASPAPIIPRPLAPVPATPPPALAALPTKPETIS